ncbi:hypothetical protein QLY66_21590, partial [Cronobacter sakazakii]|nr:hypothetical protein [Cronobacter sakazakii]
LPLPHSFRTVPVSSLSYTIPGHPPVVLQPFHTVIFGYRHLSRDHINHGKSYRIQNSTRLFVIHITSEAHFSIDPAYHTTPCAGLWNEIQPSKLFTQKNHTHIVSL